MLKKRLLWIRIGVGALSGLLLWLAWQTSSMTSPEAESIKLRYWLSINFFDHRPIAGVLAEPNTWNYSPNWWGFLPLAIIFGALFPMTRTLPRFLLWLGANTLVTLTSVYCFEVMHTIVPFGGPLIVLNCAYLCGTLIYLETEKIERNRSAALDLQMQAEEERKRIAKELHDETLPSLTKVMRLADKMSSTQSEKEIPQEIRGRLESVLAEMRRVIDDLHPAVLENLGLAPSLEHIVQKFARDANIEAVFKGNISDLELPPFHALCIYRIAQEALTNVEKHSGATKVEVTLEKADNVLVLRVCDNGTAAGAIKPKANSHGVRNIIHRAGLIGAKVQWKKSELPPTGTVLVVTIPIQGSEPQPDERISEQQIQSA